MSDEFDAAFDSWYESTQESEPDAEDENTEDKEAGSEGHADQSEDSGESEGNSSDESGQAEGDKEDEPPKNGPIPYARFAQIAKERRELKAKLAELERERAQTNVEPEPPKRERVRTGDPEIDALLDEMDQEEGGDNTEDPIDQRLQKLERAQAKTAYQAEMAKALAEYPDVDQKAVTDGVLASGGHKSPAQVAKALYERSEEHTASSVSKFLDANPDLKALYEAKEKGDKEGSGHKAPAPNLKNSGSKKTKTNTDPTQPRKGESNEDYLARLLGSDF